MVNTNDLHAAIENFSCKFRYVALALRYL